MPTLKMDVFISTAAVNVGSHVWPITLHLQKAFSAVVMLAGNITIGLEYSKQRSVPFVIRSGTAFYLGTSDKPSKSHKL
jgi:hypothetical protein